MTDAMMKRLEALEAVAEAAREITRWPDGLVDGGAIVDRDAVAALWRALDALDALPASPPGEVVEVQTMELWAHGDGDVVLVVPGSRLSGGYPQNGYRRRLGTVRLALVKGAGDAG